MYYYKKILVERKIIVFKVLKHIILVCVRFVDIGGIVDHHCLNFLFIRKTFSLI